MGMRIGLIVGALLVGSCATIGVLAAAPQEMSIVEKNR